MLKDPLAAADLLGAQGLFKAAIERLLRECGVKRGLVQQPWQLLAGYHKRLNGYDSRAIPVSRPCSTASTAGTLYLAPVYLPALLGNYFQH